MVPRHHRSRPAGTRRRLTAAAALAGAAAAVLAAGCGGPDREQAAPCAVQGAGTRPREGAAAGRRTMLLTGVAVSSSRCGDRVVFTFRRHGAARPGYRVEYRPASRALVEDGSGRLLSAAGRAFLVVRFEPAATATFSGGRLVFTYRGPRRIRPERARVVAEVLRTGDFEAVLTWVVGARERVPFAVRTQRDPPRVTVELAAPDQ